MKHKRFECIAMLSEASRRLVADHRELDQVFEEVKAALEAANAETAYAKLDLLWARLAVHIRAEHLLLFPAIVNALKQEPGGGPALPSLADAEKAIGDLREDHDFFMHALASAVEFAREARSLDDPAESVARLKRVQQLASSVATRLAEHNVTEEDHLYGWLQLLLPNSELTTLSSQIRDELLKRPQRFTERSWSDVVGS